MSFTVIWHQTIQRTHFKNSMKRRDPARPDCHIKAKNNSNVFKNSRCHHSPRQNHPQRSAEDYCDDTSTAMKKWQDHSNVYRKTKPDVCLGTGTAPLRATTFWTPATNSHCLVLKKREMIRRTAGHIFPEKAEFSLVVAFASSHQVLVATYLFSCSALFSFFFFLQLHLIYFSQHPERNNTKKNATCWKRKKAYFDKLRAEQTPWNINKRICMNERKRRSG